MIQPDLAQYATDHLFLLVGENPMPNYVAGKLLLNPGGKIYLVYSQRTQEQASELEKIFQGAVAVDLGDRESNPFHIENKLKKHIPKQGSLGLHYTGGTKAMAVHAYRTFMSQRAPEELCFSYLNPRTLKLCIEDYKEGRLHEIPVARAVEPETLKEIITLHGLEWKGNPITEVKFPKLAAAFAQFYADEREAREWRLIWGKFRADVKPKRNNGKEKWLSENELQQKSIVIDSALSKVKQVFQQHLNASETELSLQISAEKLGIKCTDFCEWLEGFWLEEYVLQIVQSFAGELHLRKACRSLVIKDYDKPNTRFEFDIVFMHGYQLFGVSCTTASEKYLCKSKLFEALLRSQQLGGDEVRVALVCANENPDEIKRDFYIKRNESQATGNSRVEVFGWYDIPKLKIRLHKWIEDNNGGQS